MNASKLAVGFAVTLATAMACSTNDPETEDLQDPSAMSGSSGVTSSGSIGASGFAGTSGGSNSSSGFQACSQTSREARIVPIHIVFSLDVSGSMCEPAGEENCRAPNTKLSQALKALGNFFETTTNASVSFIPWCGALSDDSCNARFDKSVLMPGIVSLPSSTLLAQVDKASQVCALTPTAAAIKGAQRHALAIKPQLDGAKLITILITDGQPNQCGGLDGATEAAKAANAAGVPIYVLGVGDSLQNLNAIAQAGGTGNAIVIKTSNPNQVGADLQKALEDIRGKNIGCDVLIPKPPSGEALDYGKVNVSVNVAGKETPLLYSQGCSDLNGWSYDMDPKSGKPTKITLCKTVCDKTSKDKTAELAVQFGCATRGPN
jgi:von Willebrand factor type A domain